MIVKAILPTLIALTAFLACGADTGSADWPQWRGPNRDGVAPSSPKLLDTWPASGPPRVWKNDTIGSGKDGGSSSPIIAGGKVFIYSNQYLKAHPEKKLISADVLNKVKELKGRKFSDAEQNKLATLRDKDFNSITEFFNAAGKCVNMADGGDAALYSCVEDVFELNDIIFCLDAVTGKEVWRQAHKAEGMRTPPIWAMWGASGTPAISGNYLVVQGSVALYCLSAKDGALLWKVPTVFCNSSPLIVGNVVLAGSEPRKADKPNNQLGGAWSAYDLASGKHLWSSKNGGSEWGASLISWNGGGKQTLMAPGPVCLDAMNGNLLGQPASGEAVRHWATDVSAGDVVISRSEDMVRAFKVALPKMEKLWESKGTRGEFESASPMIYQGCVYVADHCSLRCLDLKTGEQKWVAPKEVCPETSSPVGVDGKLITHVGSNHAASNQTMMLRASPEKCEILGKLKDPVSPCSTPVVAGGLLFVRLVDGLACYDLRAQ